MLAFTFSHLRAGLQQTTIRRLMYLRILLQVARLPGRQTETLARLCVVVGCSVYLVACSAGGKDFDMPPKGGSVLRDYIIDAIEGAGLARVYMPESGTRVLFSPVGGGAPMSGGERNMGFLAAAAQHIGFNVYCSVPNRGAGLDWLEEQGVVGVAGDDEGADYVPPRIAASVVGGFDQKMRAWQAEPRSALRYENVIAAFDAIEDWAASGDSVLDDPAEVESATESIIIRGLQLRQVVRRHRIETVVADSTNQAMASLLACAHLQTRVFFYAQSAPGDSYDQMFSGRIDIMVVSDATARRFEAAPQVSVIKNGINLRRFAPPTSFVHNIRDELNIPTSAFLVGNTGYIVDFKNQITILRAAIAATKVRADVHVVFVGYILSADYKAELDAIAAANHFENNVHYLGMRGDVDSILKELDVFIFPSRYEGFGLSLAEAMATEVPSIASDLDAFHEFVGDTVELVDLRDDGTFMTAAIEKIMREPDAAKERAKRSRQQLIAGGFNTDRMVRDFALMLGARPLTDGLRVQISEPKNERSVQTKSRDRMQSL